MADSRTIVDVEIFGAQVAYRRGYRWAFNEYVGPCVLLVRIADAAGIEGWGEIPLGTHPTIPGDAMGMMVRALADRLVVGRRPAPRRFLAEASSQTGWLWFPYMGARIMCGLELALWDLIGRQRGMHVTELFGGRVREAMECMWFVFDDEPAAMADATRTGGQRDFRVFYLKWFGDESAMFAKLAAVRDALPRGGLIRVDPNESWTRASATRILHALEGWPIEFVEQPLPRFDRRGSAEVRARCTVPFSSDQGTLLLEEVLAELPLGTMDTMSVGPSDAGGLSRTLDICAVVRAAGIPVSLHSNNELGVGLAAMVAVACLAENCSYASQTEYPHLDWEVTNGLRFDGPRLSVDFDQPGWGVAIDHSALERARENYDGGASNRIVLDAPTHERHFVPGY